MFAVRFAHPNAFGTSQIQKTLAEILGSRRTVEIMIRLITRVLIVLFIVANVISAKGVDTIIGRYRFGKNVLFYVGSGYHYEVQPEVIASTGTFFLLDAVDSLLSDANTIRQRARASVRVEDVDMALRPQQIEIRDIDKGCKGNTGPEVLCRLWGPSDDPELVILGFDQDGKFRKLFVHMGLHVDTKVIAPNKLEIILASRANVSWCMYYRQSYIFNTVTKDTYKVPSIFVEPSYDFHGDYFRSFEIRCHKPVDVYFDPQSAIQKQSIALIGMLGKGWKVTFEKFYWAEEPGAVLVRSDSLSGWVNQSDIIWENFRLPMAD